MSDRPAGHPPRSHAGANWLDQLNYELDSLQTRSLKRTLVPLRSEGPQVQLASQQLINLSSNDYLGLSNHPYLKQAAIKAIEQLGVGSGASRLAGGHRMAHAAAEDRFARFKHAEAALICSSGYMANLAVLTALAGPGDLICMDKLNHASLIDAARATGADVRYYPHRNPAKLPRLLDQHRESASSVALTHSEARLPRRFIVTDSVFSMDGTVADLPTLCQLARDHDAILVIDEAHGTGVLGATGAGLCELQGVSDQVDVVVSTASKALGSLGGIVTARQVVIETLFNRARSFIYTTATMPFQPALIEAALDVLRDEPWRRQQLAAHCRMLADALIRLGLAAPRTANDPLTPIFPIIVGESADALDLASHLRNAGFFASAIRPPTVAPGTARVRIALRADLEPDHIAGLAQALARWPKLRPCA